MKPTTKNILTASIWVVVAFALVAALVLGLIIYAVVSYLTRDTSEVDLADVSSPTGIVSYVEDNVLDRYEYADVFAGKVEMAKTELVEITRKQENVLNVLLICTDVQNGNTVADMMIVLSMNTETGDVRMLSLGGDSYVPIDGHGWDKLCMSVAYGGPELAVNTVNRVFDLDVSQYAMIAKQDILAFFTEVAPLEVEMSVRQAEVFSNYFGWDCHPGMNSMNAEQLTTMVSFRDYADGVTVGDEVIIVTDADRMENIKMVARAVFRSLFALEFGTVSATVDTLWNHLDTNCTPITVKEGLQTLMSQSDKERLNLTSSSLPALNAPTYVLVQPDGYEVPAVATLYNYEALRLRIQNLLYGADDNN